MTAKLMFVEGSKQNPCIWSILMWCWPGTILRETPWRMLDSLSAALHVFRLEILVPSISYLFYINYIILYISYYLHYIYIHLCKSKPVNQTDQSFSVRQLWRSRRGETVPSEMEKVQSLGDGAQTKLKFACIKRKPISTVFLLQNPVKSTTFEGPFIWFAPQFWCHISWIMLIKSRLLTSNKSSIFTFTYIVYGTTNLIFTK